MNFEKKKKQKKKKKKKKKKNIFSCNVKRFFLKCEPQVDGGAVTKLSC